MSGISYISDSLITTAKNDFLYKLRRKIQKFVCKILGYEFITRVYYYILMRKKLRLNNPKLFSEKICWYKLNYCHKSKLIINCADKYSVRDYLKSKGFDDYLPSIIGVWDNANKINWDILPDKFALKCSHGCAYNIICLNKNSILENEKSIIIDLLNEWLLDDFGYYNAEPHYNLSHRQIFCEEYIDSTSSLPVDYKIHCLNGEPVTILTCSERESEDLKLLFYSIEGKPVSFGKNKDNESIKISKSVLKSMLLISKEIAKDFPFVRVDFYIHKNKLKIGELTFVPAAGYIDYLSDFGDKYLGDLFKLPYKKLGE